MDQVDYRSVNACVRPPRVAIVYRTEGSWMYHARQVMASISRLWGGAGMIILPTGSDDKVSPKLLGLLRLYDPDLIYGHVRTVADLPVINPDGASRLAAKLAQDDEDQAATLARLGHEPLSEDPWANVAEQINEWCSPFKGFDQDAQKFHRYEIHPLDRAGTPDRQLTLIPATDGASRVLTLRLDDVDAPLALMIETRTGSTSAASLAGFEVLSLGMNAGDVPDFIRYAVTGRPEMSNWDPHGAFQQAKRVPRLPQPPALLTATEFADGTPMARSRLWTTRVRNGDAPVVCVIGETAEDHALALLCDRMFHHGAWIPTSLLKQGKSTAEGRAVMLGLQGLRYLPGAARNRPVLVTSASEPLDQIAPIVEKIASSFMMVCLDGSPIPSDPDFIAIAPEKLAAERHRHFLADPAAFAVPLTVPVRASSGDMSILTPIPLPLPQIADQDEDVQWCIDVAIGRYSAPPRTALASRVFLQDPVGIPDTVTRAGRDGVTFGSANVGFVMAGAPREGHLAHPLLRFPSAETIFAELASAQSATVERSSAGRRASMAVELWGSLDALRADLKGPVRQLLNAFLPATRKGAYETGYAIRGDGYLTFQHAKAALGCTDDEQPRSVLDRMLRAKILRRGLVLNCDRCRWQAFYRIEEFGASSFPCSACGNVSRLTKGTWANKEPEPVWHYSLDQVVRDLLRQHGDVPLLAVEHLAQARQRRDVLWSPELTVTDSAGEEVELDIAVIIDGSVLVGEAKSNGALGGGAKSPTRAAQRLVAAAQILSADGIVLATSTPTWKPGMRAAIDAALSRWTRGRKPEIIELVNVGSRPPRPRRSGEGDSNLAQPSPAPAPPGGETATQAPAEETATPPPGEATPATRQTPPR